MAQKTINMITNELKENLINDINIYIQQGVSLSAVSMLVHQIAQDVDATLNNVIQRETEAYNKALEEEAKNEEDKKDE